MPFIGEKKRISWLAYERMNARFWLPNSFARHIFSSYLASIIAGSELRALGEKTYKWRRKSPAFERSEAARTHRSLPSHLCFRMETPSLLVCIGIYPFDKCPTLGEKQSVCDVFKGATEVHNPAYGLHNESTGQMLHGPPLLKGQKCTA